MTTTALIATTHTTDPAGYGFPDPVIIPQWFLEERRQIRLHLLAESKLFWAKFRRRAYRILPTIDFYTEGVSIDQECATNTCLDRDGIQVEDKYLIRRLRWRMSGLRTNSPAEAAQALAKGKPIRRIDWIWTDEWKNLSPPSQFLLRQGDIPDSEMEDFAARFRSINRLWDRYQKLATGLAYLRETFLTKNADGFTSSEGERSGFFQ